MQLASFYRAYHCILALFILTSIKYVQTILTLTFSYIFHSIWIIFLKAYLFKIQIAQMMRKVTDIIIAAAITRKTTSSTTKHINENLQTYKTYYGIKHYTDELSKCSVLFYSRFIVKSIRMQTLCFKMCAYEFTFLNLDYNWLNM